ncbi:hypothetical protein [Streptomyces fractus]|uniref:hypothetical protein n=1 Tax=Streptomyces fractus TaxID=641806 RepID=UPI003CE69CE7
MRTARLRSSVHPALWAGLAALTVGAVLCVVGWYGMSGERFAERQLPYLASCTVPGAALIVAGAVLLTYGRATLAATRMDDLHGQLMTAAPAPDNPDPAPPPAVSDRLLMVPGGTLWHRADCPLVEGKPQALPVDGGAITEVGLGPCPICEPPTGS